MDTWCKLWWLYRSMISVLSDRKVHGLVLCDKDNVLDIKAVALIQQPVAAPLHIFLLLGLTDEYADELRRLALIKPTATTSSKYVFDRWGHFWTPFALYDSPYRLGIPNLAARDTRAQLRHHLRLAGLLPEMERLMKLPDNYAGSARDARVAKAKPKGHAPQNRPLQPLGDAEAPTPDPKVVPGFRLQERLVEARRGGNLGKQDIDPGFIPSVTLELEDK
jgi:hypothetical protein